MNAGLGWYADPEDEAQERFWNGSMWTDQRRPAREGARPTPGPMVTAPRTASASTSLSTIAGFCYFIAVVMVIGAAAAGWALLTYKTCGVNPFDNSLDCSYQETHPYSTEGYIAIAGGLVQALVVAFVGYTAAETGKLRAAAEVLDR